jgi:hypothetical protein
LFDIPDVPERRGRHKFPVGLEHARAGDSIRRIFTNVRNEKGAVVSRPEFSRSKDGEWRYDAETTTTVRVVTERRARM